MRGLLGLACVVAMANSAVPAVAQGSPDVLDRAAAIRVEGCQVKRMKVRVIAICKDDLQFAEIKRQFKALGGTVVFGPLCTTPLEGPGAGTRRCELVVERR